MLNMCDVLVFYFCLTPFCKYILDIIVRLMPFYFLSKNGRQVANHMFYKGFIVFCLFSRLLVCTLLVFFFCCGALMPSSISLQGAQQCTKSKTA